METLLGTTHKMTLNMHTEKKKKKGSSPSQLGRAWLHWWFCSQTIGSWSLSVYPGSHVNDTVEPVEKLLLWRRPLTGIPGSRQESDSIFTPEKNIGGRNVTTGWECEPTPEHGAIPIIFPGSTAACHHHNTPIWRSILLSYLMLKPAAERLLSVVNNRKRTLDVEIRKWGAWVPWYSPIRGEETEGPSLISRVS